jgi:asparagine synthase (glutamine-hydrolysing)
VAAQLARRMGTDHHQIMVEPDIVALLPKLIWHLDEPIADPAVIAAYLVCREASSEVKVLLSGTGGDEVFGGYRKYLAPKIASLFQLLPPFIRRGLVEPAVTGLPSFRGSHISGLVRLAKKFVRTAEMPPQEAFLASSAYLSDDFKSQLCCAALNHGNHSDVFQQHRTYFERVKEADFLNQMLYVDTKTFLISLNLTYNDKMSMASSVEVRVPYLDKDLVEFVAMNVPPRMKIHGVLQRTTKYILRRAMMGILPQEVLNVPKAGFGAPVDYWLAQDLREMVDDLLSADRLRRRGYFNSASVARMIQEHRSGFQDWSMQIWQLLTFELWMQTFLDQPQPSIQRPRSVVT